MGVRYRLVGGTRFYERREVKDVLAYLRLLHNPNDSVSLLRVLNVPPRGIGDKSAQELQKWARAHDAPLIEAVANGPVHAVFCGSWSSQSVRPG